MTLFELILILILFGFVFSGFWFGLVKSAGNFLGIFLGAYIGGITFEFFANKLLFLFGGNLNLARVVCFIVIFVIINQLVGLLFLLLQKFTKILFWIPFTKSINRLVGAIFGFIEGTLLIGVSLYIIIQYPFGEYIKVLVNTSWVAKAFVLIAKIVTPVLPF